MGDTNVLFSDNLGRVKIYDKQIWIPTGLELSLTTEAYDDTSEIIGTSIPIFLTGFQAARTTQIQMKQSLDGRFHVLPFGEAPKTIGISGLAYAASQASPAVSQSGEPPGTASEEDDFYRQLVDFAPPPPEPEVESPKQLDDGKGWLERWTESAVTAVSDVVGDAAEAVGSVLGKASGVLTGIQKAVSSVVAVVDAITNAPAALVSALKSELGEKPADPHKPPRALKNSDLRCLSIQQLDSIFTMLQAGNMAKYNPTITIRVSGIQYTARLIQLSYQAEPNGVGYSFTMGLKCTGANVYYTNPIESTTRTRAQTTELSRLVDIGADAGFSVLRDNSDVAARLI